MYAIIATGGKQYKVSEGDIITIEKLGVDAGEKVTFDQVLAVSGYCWVSNLHIVSGYC